MRFSIPTRLVPPCGRAYFFLLRQEKVAKKKATPKSAPLRGSLRYSASAGAAQLGLRPQTVLALFPRQPALLSAFHGDPEGAQNQRSAQKTPSDGQPEKTPKNESHRQHPAGSPGPLRGAEQRRNAGGRRLALFEPQASLASRQAFRVAQGTGAAGTDPGVAFSLATFFWRSKRKYARPQGGKHRLPSTKPAQQPTQQPH